MHLKSPYPAPPPVTPTNVYNHFFPDNYPPERENIVIHIDALTGRTRTWKEFAHRVIRATTTLDAAPELGGYGIESGEMIGIMSDNCMDYLTLIHALWALTVPFALLSSHSTPFELEHLLRVSRVTRLFVHPNAWDRALLVANKLGLSEDRIHILEGHIPNRASLDDAITRTNDIPNIKAREAGKDTLAYLLFSSGTSGPPKAVMISHGNILAQMNLAQIIAAADAAVSPASSKRGIPINLAFLPLHHSYGLVVYAARSLLGPATLVIMPRWDLDLAFDLIAKYRITTINLIPSVVHQMVNSPRFATADMSSVVAAHSGAAYLSPELITKFSAVVPSLKSFREGYGMSECTMTMATIPLPGAIPGYTWTPGSCGVLVPGAEVRIFREDGSHAEINEPGDLYYRAANVGLGYYGNEKSTKETFVDGWVKTGDRFRSDGIGLFFEDRVKDTLKVSGIQVSPREIEDMLLSHPSGLVVDAVVAGVSGGRTSDEKIPRAWVVLSPAAKQQDPEVVSGALKKWSEESLSKYKWLRGGIEIVDEIPKNPTGKVLRRVLQEKFEEENVAKIRSRL